MSTLFPLFIVFALVVLTWASYRLQHAAQPLRLELAAKGERLLGDAELPPDLRAFVCFLLDTAFSNRIALLVGIFYVPYIAFSILTNPNRVAKKLRRFEIKNKETRAAFDEVMRLHDRITLANHPFLLMLVEAEILVFVAPAVVLVAVFRQVVSPEMGREAAMDLVEERGIRLRKSLPGHFARA